MPGRVEEDATLSQIDEQELVELAKSLVRIPSFIGEETPVARWLASYLSSRGYEVELQEVERGWFQTVAVLKGSGQGRSIMFNGHLDINPLASGWNQPMEPGYGHSIKERLQPHLGTTGIWSGYQLLKGMLFSIPAYCSYQRSRL